MLAVDLDADAVASARRSYALNGCEGSAEFRVVPESPGEAQALMRELLQVGLRWVRGMRGMKNMTHQPLLLLARDAGSKTCDPEIAHPTGGWWFPLEGILRFIPLIMPCWAPASLLPHEL